jgi:DNA-binding transcriptional LysR family regulator
VLPGVCPGTQSAQNVPSPNTITRRIAALEGVLQEPLFVRSVAGVALTAFGETMLQPAKRMAECATEVTRAAERAETKPVGTVRITAPPGLAYEFVAPFAGFAKTRLPEVRLVVSSTVAYLDLARGEADIALRFTAPKQREIQTLGTLEVEVGAFASKAYAKAVSPRATVADLAWISWGPPFEHLPDHQELMRLIPGFRPTFASDDFLVQLRAAEAGLGAIFLGVVRHRFWSSPLVQLAVGLPRITRKLYVLTTRQALEVPRVRAIADLLVDELRQLKAAGAPLKKPPSARRR